MRRRGWGPDFNEREKKMKHPAILAFAIALGASPLALTGIAVAQDSQDTKPAPSTQGTEMQPMQDTEQRTTDRCAVANPPADCPAGDKTGAISPSGGVNVTTEQQTQMRTIIKESDAKPLDSVDFDVSVGTTVPQSVTLQTLPPRIVEIVPAYKDYKYFMLADGRIVIVDPNNMNIVAVIA